MRAFRSALLLVLVALAGVWAGDESNAQRKKWGITLRNFVGGEDEECTTLLASVIFKYDDVDVGREKPEEERYHGDRGNDREGHNDKWEENWREDDEEEQVEIKCGGEHKFEPKKLHDGKKSCRSKVKVINAHNEYFEQVVEDPDDYKCEVHRRNLAGNQHSIFLRDFV
ncbi:hypothetical protein Pelo_15941 [Pelomyxa schiedti]|nr:hypothetical protein Pelo_15941 [Pelomyxa schiedti]